MVECSEQLQRSSSITSNFVFFWPVINPQRAFPARVMVVAVFVCDSVSACFSIKSHHTSGVSVRSENTATYSMGNEGQKLCGAFFESHVLQR